MDRSPLSNPQLQANHLANKMTNNKPKMKKQRQKILLQAYLPPKLSNKPNKHRKKQSLKLLPSLLKLQIRLINKLKPLKRKR